MSTTAEVKARVRQAVELLDDGLTPAAVAKMLAHTYGCGFSTAKRYVTQAIAEQPAPDPDLSFDAVSLAAEISIAHKRMRDAIVAGDLQTAAGWQAIHSKLCRQVGHSLTR